MPRGSRRRFRFGLGLLLAGLALQTAVQLERQRRAQARDYRQIESLFSLFAVLRIEHPLPPMRGWAVSPDLAATLVSLILERKPGFVLELGSGVSTLLAAYTLKKVGSGRILSLEHDEAYAAASAEDLRRHGLEGFASIRHAPLRPLTLNGQSWLWYDPALLDDVKAIDLALIDGPPGDLQRLARYPALPVLMPRLSPDAEVVMDDYRRRDEREIASRWLREFEEFSGREVDTEKGAIVLSRRARAPRRSP
jgi:predicted O-methyltransferase YrrM